MKERGPTKFLDGAVGLSLEVKKSLECLKRPVVFWGIELLNPNIQGALLRESLELLGVTPDYYCDDRLHPDKGNVNGIPIINIFESRNVCEEGTIIVPSFLHSFVENYFMGKDVQIVPIQLIPAIQEAEVKGKTYADIPEVINKLLKRKGPLIFLGTDRFGEHSFEMLGELGIRPDYFCVLDEQHQQRVFRGVPVIGLSDLCRKFQASTVLITQREKNDIYELQNFLYQQDLEVIEPPHIWKRLYRRNVHPSFCFMGAYSHLIEKNIELFEEIYELFKDQQSKEVFSNLIKYKNSGNASYLSSIHNRTEQYFDEDIFRFGENEVFLDGGAYTGDNTTQFINKVKGKFHKIYVFEPNDTMLFIAKRRLSKYNNVYFYQNALWDQEQLLGFDMIDEGSMGNKISEGTGTYTVHANSIDHVLQGEPVTFIKLDIEGAELKALSGAKKTITTFKPKLAVCLYHRNLDLVAIAKYIKDLVPRYNFYLRHYSDAIVDTILYCDYNH